MTITIQQTAIVGAMPTEQQGLIIKSERIYIRICERGKFKKVVVPFSADQCLSTMTNIIAHN